MFEYTLTMFTVAMVPIVLNKLFWSQACILHLANKTLEINLSSKTKLGMLPDVSHHLPPVAHQTIPSDYLSEKKQSCLDQDYQSPMIVQ